ncbi:Transcriptional regulator CRZ1 [Escovopsis weberi]|uniref:Transcriptional regulator CRZ1 n=1 Tax=Escovopsis weberi TaxID=150374 RepID=A0A0M8N0R6_ESCWE|nr:Transcriptional regulator CRZ1 [Escovopsis weberi]
MSLRAAGRRRLLSGTQQQQLFPGSPNPNYDSFGAGGFLGPQLEASDPSAGFDPSASFAQQPSTAACDSTVQSQQYLSTDLNGGDFSLFPSAGDQGDQYGSPLFDQTSFNPSDLITTASPVTLQTPTSPQMLQLESLRSQAPPAYLFSSPPNRHSRNVSLGPEAALLPNQLHDWTQPQFQGHRRTPSEYSDVSSVAPSPHLVSSDTFENFGYPGITCAPEAFPSLQAGPSEVPQMAPPAINIDYAPTNSKPGNLEPSKSQMDQDSLTPPDRVPNNVIALRLADPEYQNSHDAGTTKRTQKHPATFQCTLCPKRFTRAYNLRSHLRTHTDERPFVCTVCGKAFARQHDRKRHESLHSGEKKFVCKGDLKAGGLWGCGRRFARADALGRHFRSEAGRICIKPLLDEEMIERQRQWQEQRMQQQNMSGFTASQPMVMDGPAYPMDAGGQYALPAALLAQYPALAQMNWSTDLGGTLDDELSGRSSFDASDYDEGDDGGYISGSGTGYAESGGMNQNFGDLNFDKNEYTG